MKEGRLDRFLLGPLHEFVFGQFDASVGKPKLIRLALGLLSLIKFFASLPVILGAIVVLGSLDLWDSL